MARPVQQCGIVLWQLVCVCLVSCAFRFVWQFALLHSYACRAQLAFLPLATQQLCSHLHLSGRCGHL